MTTRKADFDAENEPGSKRARLNDNDDLNNIADGPSLDVVNDDCLLLILSYLPVDDLNSIAICNQRCRKARAHESLDQTRKGTIVVSERSTFESIVLAIARNGWNRVFQGNRTHLEIVGLERLGETEPGISTQEIARGVSLTGVTSLDLQCCPNRQTSHKNMQRLASLIPDLKQADFGNLSLSLPSRPTFAGGWPMLAKVTWNRCDQALWWDGSCKLYSSKISREFYLDNACFITPGDEDIDRLTYSWLPCFYLFSWCCYLEKLSIKSATIKKVGSHDEAQSISQDMMIKMVRHHPSLQWLRSDLSVENVAMLKAERPDITFVSD